MRIDSLRLLNYRCFEDFRIEFDSKLTVIVAPNGGGKTAILDALAVALSPFVGRTGSARGKKFHARDSRSVLVKADESKARIPSPFYEISLEAAGEIDKEAQSWRRRKRTARGDTTSKESEALSAYADRLLEQLRSKTEAHKVELPLIAYYGTSRLWGPRQVKGKTGAKPLVPRPLGYQGSLSASSRFDSFSVWFKNANHSLLMGRMRNLERGGSELPEHMLLEGIVRNVKDAVRHCLTAYGDCYLDYRTTDYAITITDVSRLTQLELDQQSDGVQSILSMVGDIASRTSILNPQFGAEAAKKTSGIILIDEIDMHLHPSWQQTVLQSLQDAFPRIQFIVTTHSPQVLTTVSKQNIRVVLRNTDDSWTALPPATSPLAKESSDALAHIMGTHPRPQLREILPDIHAYEKLARCGRMHSKEALAIRNRLENAGFEFSAAEEDLFRFLGAKTAKTKRNGS